MHTYTINTSEFAIRDNGSKAVGLVGIIPYREDIADDMCVVDMSKILDGSFTITHEPELTNPEYHDMNLGEIMRCDFNIVDGEGSENVGVGYIRTVYADKLFTKKIHVFFACMKRAIMATLMNETVYNLDNGFIHSSREVPKGFTLGQLPTQVLSLPTGESPYSLNAMKVDDANRLVYKAIIDSNYTMGDKERVDLYLEHFPNERFINTCIYDNEFLKFLDLTVFQNMDSTEAMKTILAENE